MKKVLCLTVCALSLLAFASTAQSDGGGSANGDFTFAVGTAAGAVQFDALMKGGNKPAEGNLLFTATIDIAGEVCMGEETGCLPEPTGDNYEGGVTTENVTLTAQFDRMVVDGKRASMSGQVTSDSPWYGQQAILTVENHVAGISPPTDAFVWGVYKPKTINLTAKDYGFCPTNGPNHTAEDEEFACDGLCPWNPVCNTDGFVSCVGEFCTTTWSYSLTWGTGDYELCPHNDSDETARQTPWLGTCDPRTFQTGIPVLATQLITHADSFPLAAYPLLLIPNVGGNEITVKGGH
jgi:hypothetical protein